MEQEKERQVDKLLQAANKTWNYFSASIERLIFKPSLSAKDKEYLLFSKRKARQIKAMLSNIKELIGVKENPLPRLLEKSVCKKLKARIDEMVLISLELDRIYLK